MCALQSETVNELVNTIGSSTVLDIANNHKDIRSNQMNYFLRYIISKRMLLELDTSQWGRYMKKIGK